MRPIQVLVVDDAVTVRRLLVDALSIDPDVLVVATAANGRVALAKIQHFQPDLVILDLEMPDMGGLETLVEIRKQWPQLPVIVFSSVTRHGASETLEALWLGANDYVTKTARTGADAVTHVREELIPRIKALCPGPRGARSATTLPAPRRASSHPVQMVAIGVSTGGPRALATLLAALPPDLPVPILIVQHMPALFTKLLAEGLTGKSALPVTEGHGGDVVEPGRVVIAPGDTHMTVRRDGSDVKLQLDRRPPVNGCRPAVDPMLQSVAQVYGAGALAVILTGMGQDGVRGCQQIVEQGGHVLVQDEASSVVWGMPGSVVRAGFADQVLDLENLAHEIARRGLERRRRRNAA